MDEVRRMSARHTQNACKPHGGATPREIEALAAGCCAGSHHAAQLDVAFMLPSHEIARTHEHERNRAEHAPPAMAKPTLDLENPL